MLNFDFLGKGLVYHVIFYYLSKFHGLIAFTSWDVGEYVHCDCLLARL